MNTSSLEQLFKAADLVIFHLKGNKDYQQIITTFGLTPKRVQEGSALLKNARQLHATQETHYDTARDMSLQIEKDREAALDVFKDHVAIAKSSFRKEPQALQTLKINKMAGTQWRLVQQAVDFYTKAPQYMERLQQYGATQEGFDQSKAAVEALLTLQALRLKKKGDAEDTTQQKKEAVKALREWYGEFRKLARIAFKKNPQVLETFGIVVLSAPRKRKATEEAPEIADVTNSK